MRGGQPLRYSGTGRVDRSRTPGSSVRKARISRCPHARSFKCSVVQYLTCGGFRRWTIRLARLLKCAVFEVRAGHNVGRDLV